MRNSRVQKIQRRDPPRYITQEAKNAVWRCGVDTRDPTPSIDRGKKESGAHLPSASCRMTTPVLRGGESKARLRLGLYQLKWGSAAGQTTGVPQRRPRSTQPVGDIHQPANAPAKHPPPVYDVRRLAAGHWQHRASAAAQSGRRRRKEENAPGHHRAAVCRGRSPYRMPAGGHDNCLSPLAIAGSSDGMPSTPARCRVPRVKAMIVQVRNQDTGTRSFAVAGSPIRLNCPHRGCCPHRPASRIAPRQLWQRRRTRWRKQIDRIHSGPCRMLRHKKHVAAMASLPGRTVAFYSLEGTRSGLLLHACIFTSASHRSAISALGPDALNVDRLR
jgi:hypothetical protein